MRIDARLWTRDFRAGVRTSVPTRVLGAGLGVDADEVEIDCDEVPQSEFDIRFHLQ